ncbi:MAG: TAT-variant-translocated molybdopterin oxidoreductase, partial [Anaerolineales bacterium]|nr:TAT-variant-translocated molybdopterin oxidoreductase [Anaerolineales bacterium]
MTQPQQHPPTPWRSLDEFANTPAFQSWLKREFPQGAPLLANPVSRRAFLQLAAASLGLAGLAACTPRPAQRIVPYVTQPELLTPGEPLTFATAVPHAGFARGVLAESRQGRPVKLEGNPAHPATRGSSDPFTQAALLGLYDPDRAQTVQHNGRIRTWADFLHMLNGALPPDGDGLRLLSGAVTSPTLQAQRAALLAAMPSARWVEYEPIDDTNARQGAVLAFGMPRVPRYDFNRADVILSLGSDFLQVPPGHLAYARAFGARRTV